MNCSSVQPDVATARPSDCSRGISDLSLLASMVKGNPTAMRLLFERHHAAVFRCVLRVVRNEAIAEELVDDVFFEAWRGAAAFEGRSQVSTWLLGIARHKALSAIRHRTTKEIDDEVVEMLEDSSDNPEVAMQKLQKCEILLDCVKQLSAAHREVIDLVYYQEKSIDEAAEIIDVPPNTAKTRMFYARKEVALMLTAQGVDRASL